VNDNRRSASIQMERGVVAATINVMGASGHYRYAASVGHSALRRNHKAARNRAKVSTPGLGTPAQVSYLAACSAPHPPQTSRGFSDPVAPQHPAPSYRPRDVPLA
jgi:hypothetical protein